jgi:hypothetical protein
MKLVLAAGCVAVAALVIACSGKIATVGSDGGEGNAQATGSSGATGSGSSNGGVTGSSGASSSGVGSSSNSGGSGSSGASSSSGSVGGDDAGVFDAGGNCGAIPMVHQNPPGDIYCGYDTDGGALECLASAGDGMCCLGGSLGNGMYAAQVCSPNAMVGCPNGGEEAGGTPAIPIQCNQIADCTANGFPGATACCLQGASAPSVVPGCGYLTSRFGSAIVCEGSGGGGATSCAAGEVQICSSPADCPSGTTCAVGKWKIFQLGFCQ